MNNPVGIVELSRPGIEGRIRGNVLEVGREQQKPCFEFFTLKGDDMVFPGIFESLVIEVCLANPCFIEEGKPACRGGKMDMDIPFKVSAKGVDGEKDTGKKTLFERQVFNDGCSDEGDTVHEIAVKPEKHPEFRRQ